MQKLPPRRLTPVPAMLCAAFASPLAAPVYAADTTLGEVQVERRAPASDYAPPYATVGGSGEPKALRDIPQAVTVIDRAVLDSQAATTLKDALRNVPGITLSAGEGGQIGDNINLRGFSTRTDIFLDGFRDRGQYARDTFSLEAVEVLKGPASMLFGRGTTGGVINQVSKQPGLGDHSEVSATLGTDAYYRATVDTNQQLGETSALRVSAMGQSIGSTRDTVEQNGWGIAPSFRTGIGTDTDITLSALVQRNRDIPDYGFPLLTESGAGSIARPVDAPKNRYYGYADDFFDQDVEVFNATLRHRISPALSLSNRTQYSTYRLQARPTPLGAVAKLANGSTPTLSTPLDLVNVARQDKDREIQDTSFYNQTELVAKFATGAVKNTVTSGLELGIEGYHNDYFTWTPTNLNVNLGHPQTVDRSGKRYLSSVTDTDAQSAAIYLNEQADLGREWKLVAGLRWDRYAVSSRVLNYSATGVASVPAQPAEHTDHMLSTRAGVLYQPTATQSWYVSYGTSFNPSAEAVSQSVSTAALDPEQNRSIEVGTKWDFFAAALQFSAAMFQIDKTNARTTDAVTGVVSLDGEVRVRGFELGLLGRLAENWQVIAGYTFLDGEIVASHDIGTGNNAGIAAQGKAYPNTPQHSASLWTTYRVLPEWEVGGGAFYASSRYLNNFETAEVDGYVRLDATLAWLRRDYDVRLNLLNLGDATYYDVASGGRATPARGRTGLLTATYRF